MTYKFSPDEKNEVVRKLADQYPKTFFEIPRHRVPLMKNVVTALRQDGFPVAGELVSETIDWYMSHLSYQYNLGAGRKRINLHGREEGTVTEQEERIAKKKIAEINDRRLTDRHLYDPVKAATQLKTSGQMSDDQFRKIDAPKTEATPMASKAKPVASLVCPELESVYRALLTASAAMPALASNVDMQIALLNVISSEVQHVIASIRQAEENE
jgi:sRNA-binding protein